MVGKRSRFAADIDHTNAYSDHSDSSDNSDYNENEKILLSKVKRKRKDDSDSVDEAIFDVASDEDTDSDDKSDIALSDIEDHTNEDDLPNVKAWGKDKRSYYSTDYVDQDYGGYAGKDALNADFEEEEAQNLQLQLAKQLEDEDFLLIDSVTKRSSDKKIRSNQVDELIKTDISNLTKRQQIQLLEKESPEFSNLVRDFEEKIALLKDVLMPANGFCQRGKIPKSDASNFIILYKDLLLNYCTNITMYLLLKSQRVKLQSHPIIKRLLQYRQLISKIEPIYEMHIAKQLIDLIQHSKVHKALDKQKHIVTRKHNNKCKNKISNIVSKEETKDLLTAFEKHVEETEEIGFTEEKRAITYQMKKNKGLMPARKKEQRNPRVKHRNKFRKAQIRRKGAVREVRTEVNRYGGEISGIKASVAKGIKIK